MDRNRALSEVILQTDLPLGERTVQRGKVRDIYDLGDALLFVATDRISAFDVVLPNGIPGKGHVLTQLSLFWFHWLETQEPPCPHHLITGHFDDFPKQLHPYREILEGRSLLVQKVAPLPIEAVVRGYLYGSGWEEYKEKGTVCGQRLPKGLCMAACLPEPIFTPSTKGKIGEHDLPLTFEDVQKRIGPYAEAVREKSLKIYTQAAAYAEARGILIADTKMEFGVDPKDGRLLVIDEMLTPDSSRFWLKEAYQPGQRQVGFDKQAVRDYLTDIQFRGKTAPPHLPESVIQQTSTIYLEALERLTGATIKMG